MKTKRSFRNPSANVYSDDEEIEALSSRVLVEAPPCGSVLPYDNNLPISFSGIPISRRTLKGLHDGKLTTATEIQAAAIPHALAGRDILGAAKTGSGKTLSFVIPLVERLYRERWGQEDGLGALVISPTRELALQIFDVIRVVGRQHALSAGLITGGKKEYEEEQQKIVRMNILVATPGRLLQHLEQTSGFDASSLQVLILDEADRLLDMGFSHQLDAILAYLPSSRQTLLFSATQTKSVKDLARLSLRSPEYIAVHAEADQPTPQKLKQHYLVCQLAQKLDVLFSFMKSHLGSKIIVFMSTCSQVRFVFECFCGMQPGIPLLALHGKIKQERRTIIFMDFLRKKSACMFATDIAARGLDFPAVDWVVQLDAPEDASMYIHRVGRTARYQALGRALLILTTTEEHAVLKELAAAELTLTRLTVNPRMAMSVAQRAAALLAEQPECRNLAKKAFSGYLRSLTLLPAHRAIDPTTLPLDEFSASLGLAFTPLAPKAVSNTATGRSDIREKKNVNRALDKLKKQIKAAKEAKKAQNQLAHEGTTGQIGSDKKSLVKSAFVAGKDEEENEDLLVVKKVTYPGDGDIEDMNQSEDEEGDAMVCSDEKLSKSKKRQRERLLRIRPDGTSKAVPVTAKIAFDDEGQMSNPLPKMLSLEVSTTVSGDAASVEARASAVLEHSRRVRARLDAHRQEDALRDKERVRTKHRELRLRDKGDRADSAGGVGAGAVLASCVDDDMGGEQDSSDDNDDNDSDDVEVDRNVFDSDDDDDDGDGGNDVCYDDDDDVSSGGSDVDVALVEQQALRLLR